VQDCANPTDNDEIHLVPAKGSEDSEIVNAWLWHPEASEEIVRNAGVLAGAHWG
jgi:hypothetical protein